MSKNLFIYYISYNQFQNNQEKIKSLKGYTTLSSYVTLYDKSGVNSGNLFYKSNSVKGYIIDNNCVLSLNEGNKSGTFTFTLNKQFSPDKLKNPILLESIIGTGDYLGITASGIFEWINTNSPEGYIGKIEIITNN